MIYSRSVVDVVDAAIDRHRSCAGCGAPNTLQSDEDRLLIICSTLAAPRRDFLGRLGAALRPHDRVLVLP